MSFVEFIGLVISLGAMIFLIIKRTYDERQRRKNPQEYARREQEREENLRKFLKERGVDVRNGGEEAKKTSKARIFAVPSKMPLPPQKPHTQTQRKYQKPLSGLSTHALEFSTHAEYDLKPAETYEVIRVEGKTKGNLVLQGLKSPREMLIIKEIFDKPLSMR
jgi:hypothetical protein